MCDDPLGQGYTTVFYTPRVVWRVFPSIEVEIVYFNATDYIAMYVWCYVYIDFESCRERECDCMTAAHKCL